MSETSIQISVDHAAEMLTGTDPDSWGGVFIHKKHVTEVV